MGTTSIYITGRRWNPSSLNLYLSAGNSRRRSAEYNRGGRKFWQGSKFLLPSNLPRSDGQKKETKKC
jgi:hypothetical protein